MSSSGSFTSGNSSTGKAMQFIANPVVAVMPPALARFPTGRTDCALRARADAPPHRQRRQTPWPNSGGGARVSAGGAPEDQGAHIGSPSQLSPGMYTESCSASFDWLPATSFEASQPGATFAVASARATAAMRPALARVEAARRARGRRIQPAATAIPRRRAGRRTHRRAAHRAAP